MADSLLSTTEHSSWIEPHQWEADPQADLLERAVELFKSADSDRCAPELLRFLRTLIDFDRGVVIVFRRSRPPWSCFDEGAGEKVCQEENRRYGHDRLYLEDHCYQMFLQRRVEGFYCFSDFDRGALESWGRIGCTRYGAELGFVGGVDDGTAIVVKLLRSSEDRMLTTSELSRLRAVEGIVTAALRMAWKTQFSNQLPKTGRKTTLYDQVQLALDEFGVEELTKRERQVIRLGLSGLPTRDVAEKLGIATATAVVHRKRAYSKLGISCQSELFATFIRSLSKVAV